jgi:ectoine hydroxylase-related dioxygenase (phytanoyl-CoA dioxygenase family)
MGGTDNGRGGSIRAVTAEEVRFYDEHGWVMLRELVSPELAGEMLAAGQRALASTDTRAMRGTRTRGNLGPEGVEPFSSVVFSREMALVARSLINRARLSDFDVPIQYHADSLWCKEPGAEGTMCHQDDVVRPGDRGGVFNLWLALDEVTPEMGAMRFLTGVHREGPLGLIWDEADELEPDGEVEQTKVTQPDRALEPGQDPLLTYYPRLLDLYPLSPPFHYQPGDATVHHSWMIHGAPSNTTDRQRWSFIMEYMAADTRYFFDGDTRRMSGKQQRSLPEQENPIVYPERSPH